jgi:DNA modification methylase
MWHGVARWSSEGTLHPTQKPVSLMRWCLDFFPQANVILDPFMGSGTTLRAAKDLGRKAIGIEIEERYCEIAAKRLQQSVMTLV